MNTIKTVLLKHQWTIGIIGMILLAWKIITWTQLAPVFLLPAPETVFQTLLEMTFSGRIWPHISITVFRVMAGFTLSALIAVPLGLWIATAPQAHAFFSPLLTITKYVPIIAFLPLLILALGIGDESKVIFLVLGTAPHLTAMVVAAVERIPAPLLETAKTQGFSKLELLCFVVVPYASPQLIEAGRVSMAFCWSWIMVAELIAASSGLGHLIVQSQRYLQTETIFVCILLITLLGFLFDFAFSQIRQQFFPWEEKTFQQKNLF